MDANSQIRMMASGNGIQHPAVHLTGAQQQKNGVLAPLFSAQNVNSSNLPRPVNVQPNSVPNARNLSNSHSKVGINANISSSSSYSTQNTSDGTLPSAQFIPFPRVLPQHIMQKSNDRVASFLNTELKSLKESCLVENPIETSSGHLKLKNDFDISNALCTIAEKMGTLEGLMVATDELDREASKTLYVSGQWQETIRKNAQLQVNQFNSLQKVILDNSNVTNTNFTKSRMEFGTLENAVKLSIRALEHRTISLAQELEQMKKERLEDQETIKSLKEYVMKNVQMQSSTSCENGVETHQPPQQERNDEEMEDEQFLNEFLHQDGPPDQQEPSLAKVTESSTSTTEQLQNPQCTNVPPTIPSTNAIQQQNEMTEHASPSTPSGDPPSTRPASAKREPPENGSSLINIPKTNPQPTPKEESDLSSLSTEISREPTKDIQTPSSKLRSPEQDRNKRKLTMPGEIIEILDSDDEMDSSSESDESKRARTL